MRLINIGGDQYIDADKVNAIDIDLLTGMTQVYVGGKLRFCTMMPIDEVVEKIRHVEENEQHDCEHCSKTFGSFGCCSTVNNEMIYSCEEGHREYEQDHRDRECETCRYCEVPAYEEPCKSCMRNHKDNWRAKK